MQDFSVDQPIPSGTTDMVTKAWKTHPGGPAEGGEPRKIIENKMIDGKKHYQFEGSRDWIHMDKCSFEIFKNTSSERQIGNCQSM